MTEAQIRARVARWQRRLRPLGLEHWEIGVTLVDTPDGKEGAEACVHTSSHYDSADIEVRRGYLVDISERDLDRLIVHELLHIIFRDFEAITELLVQELGTTASELTDKQMNHHQESIIDRLARTIVLLST